MTEVLNQGLLIAAIGMGLVFLALIFLWGLMALMAKIPAEKESEKVTPSEEVSMAIPEVEMIPESAVRKKAAVAAVATALGLQKSAMSLKPRSPHAISSWLVTRRSGQYIQNVLIKNRKSRGSAR